MNELWNLKSGTKLWLSRFGLTSLVVFKSVRAKYGTSLEATVVDTLTKDTILVTVPNDPSVDLEYV